MKNLKRLIAFLLVLSFAIGSFSALAATTPKIAIDGTVMSIPASYGAPYIDSANRTQVPIRAISEGLGLKVDWNQATSTATINGNIKIKLGEKSITTPYGTVTMDTTAISKNGRTYVPIRFLANALGYDISSSTSNGVFTVNIITKVSLNISAAASLRNAMVAIQTLYQAQKPNATLTFTYGASGTLQTQIEEGAKVDVFLSAATMNMDALKTKGLLLDGSVKNLLGNKLVLIVPSSSKLTISSFKDVANSSVKSVGLGLPLAVPAGQYAQDVFEYYNVWDTVKAKAVFGSPVTQILTWVETGNVDCGVVYYTDAAASSKVKVVATASEASHTPIIYPAAIIKTSTHPVAAADFINFLTSDEAIAIFKAYGFSIA